MSAILWTLLCVSFLLAGTFAFWTRAQLRLAGVRLRLVERREADLLEAVRRLGESSRESSRSVLAELERTLRAAAPSIDAVLIFEAHGEELAALHVGGARAEHFERVRYRIDGEATPLTRAAINGHRCGLETGMRALLPNDRAALAVPLGAVPQRGVVYVSTSKHRVIEGADTLVRLVEQAAAPLALARERETDRAKATYDGLTGLFTARAFRARLAEEISTARLSAHASLSLWFIDTDHFKRVNDTYGHGAGDIVLQQMAEILCEHVVFGIDVAARNGGDEYCAIIKNVPKSVAITRAQTLCDAVAAFDFGMGIDITASVGVATFPGDARSAHELLEVADAAMYHSKRSGRNCVSFQVDGVGFTRYGAAVERVEEG